MAEPDNGPVVNQELISEDTPSGNSAQQNRPDPPDSEPGGSGVAAFLGSLFESIVERFEGLFEEETSAHEQQYLTMPQIGDSVRPTASIGMFSDSNQFRLEGTQHIDMFFDSARLGFTVTAGREEGHNPGSLHGRGRAIDVRTRDQTTAQIDAFIAEMQQRGYRVRDERTRPPNQDVWTGPHLHLSAPERSTRTYSLGVDFSLLGRVDPTQDRTDLPRVDPPIDLIPPGILVP
jgi:hypothetical protein